MNIKDKYVIYTKNDYINKCINLFMAVCGRNVCVKNSFKYNKNKAYKYIWFDVEYNLKKIINKYKIGG
jgi:hypothetical protein